jgi:uncharacterized protein
MITGRWELMESARTMDYLIYGRAAPGAAAVDTPELDEAHWSYMDAFADRMTARGPTLTADREAWTGSLHVVNLENGTAANAFAVNDPYHRAGLFRDHLIRRFGNLLGRTMWDTTPRPGDAPFLLIADTGEAPTAGPVPPPPPSSPAAARLVVWGLLHPIDDDPELSDRPSGVALAVLAPTEDAAREVIAAQPTLLAGLTNWEIHAWEFGGRR